MSSVVHNIATGEQLDLGRECWFSHEAVALLERACDDPRIGPDKVLAVLLHDGLGCPLALVARVQHTTKNVVKTRVIIGRTHFRRLCEAEEN